VSLARPLDTLLDRSIVLGYSKLGYGLRSRRWPADDPPRGALRGRVALVTGASSGLGKATVAGLAALGASVRMLVRDRERGESARAEIARAVPGAALELELCDISDLAAVQAFAEAFLDRVPVLDVLVHNAGVLSPRRRVTGEGNELTLATNVLGPHLLTRCLLPALREAAPSRVIWVSSGGMYGQPLQAGDLQYEQGSYDGTRAYARTKRMQVVLAELWAERLSADGIVVHSDHPGWADTPGLSDSLATFHRLAGPLLRTPEQGADTTVWLAAGAEPARSSGRFWHDRRPRPTHYLGRTHESEADRRSLWEQCERLTLRTARAS